MKDNATKAAEEGVLYAENILTQDWPIPLPFNVESSNGPYPLEALPITIQDAVRETVNFSQFPTALAACSALSVVSVAGQAMANVRRAPKLEGPCGIYTLVIADSGERKTAADNFFMTALYNFDKKMREENKKPLADYRADLSSFEAKQAGLKARLMAAKKKNENDLAAENELRHLEYSKPKEPMFPQVVYTDATPEALAAGLKQRWPAAGVISAEAGVVFGGHAMGKDSVMRNLALLNTLWDGKPFKVDRVLAGSYMLEGARLSMGLAVQPGTVRAFFDNCKGLARDTGFASRFLIAWPQSTQGTRFFRDPPHDWPGVAKFLNRIEHMLRQIPTVDDEGLNLPTLEFSADAKAAWISFHDEVEKELAVGGTMVETRDVASKAADNTARLAALFHLFEGEGTASSISLSNTIAATKIVSWHLREARRFLGDVLLPPKLLQVKKLDAWLLEWCHSHKVAEVSTTDIMQRGPSFARNKNSLDTILAELENLGRVRQLKRDRTRSIMINPGLLEAVPDNQE